jgi:predicted phosphoribosyltransferase
MSNARTTVGQFYLSFDQLEDDDVENFLTEFKSAIQSIGAIYKS